MGIRTAFRLAMIRNKMLSSSTVSPISINGTKRCGFALAVLRCGFCVKPFIKDEFRCQSCTKPLEKGTPATIYKAPGGATSTIYSHAEIGECFYLQVQYIHCSSCSRPAIANSTPCPACAAQHGPGTDIYISLVCEPCSAPAPSSETSVREVFKDEISEYDM